jgi:hypothetical protein
MIIATLKSFQPSDTAQGWKPTPPSKFLTETADCVKAAFPARLGRQQSAVGAALFQAA